MSDEKRPPDFERIDGRLEGGPDPAGTYVFEFPDVSSDNPHSVLFSNIVLKVRGSFHELSYRATAPGGFQNNVLSPAEVHVRDASGNEVVASHRGHLDITCRDAHVLKTVSGELSGSLTPASAYIRFRHLLTLCPHG
jgi:hypothetical protein